MTLRASQAESDLPRKTGADRFSLMLTGQSIENVPSVPISDNTSNLLISSKGPIIRPGSMKFPLKIDSGETFTATAAISIDRDVHTEGSSTFGVDCPDQPKADFSSLLIAHSMKLPVGSPTGSQSRSLSSPIRKSQSRKESTGNKKAERLRASPSSEAAANEEGVLNPAISPISLEGEKNVTLEEENNGDDGDDAADCKQREAEGEGEEEEEDEGGKEEAEKGGGDVAADVLMDRMEEGSFHSFADSDEDLTIVDELVESMLSSQDQSRVDTQRWQATPPTTFADEISFRRDQKAHNMSLNFQINPSDPEVLLMLQRIKEIEPEPPRIPARPANRPKQPLKLTLSFDQQGAFVDTTSYDLDARQSATLSRSLLSQSSSIVMQQQNSSSSSTDRILEVSSPSSRDRHATRRQLGSTKKVDIRVNLASLTKRQHIQPVSHYGVVEGEVEEVVPVLTSDQDRSIFDEGSFYLDKGARFGDDIAVDALLMPEGSIGGSPSQTSKLFDFLVSNDDNNAGPGGGMSELLDLASVASDGSDNSNQSYSRNKALSQLKRKAAMDPLVRVITSMTTVTHQTSSKPKVVNSLLVVTGNGVAGGGSGVGAYVGADAGPRRVSGHGSVVIGEQAFNDGEETHTGTGINTYDERYSFPPVTTAALDDDDGGGSACGSVDTATYSIGSSRRDITTAAAITKSIVADMNSALGTGIPPPDTTTATALVPPLLDDSIVSVFDDVDEGAGFCDGGGFHGIDEQENLLLPQAGAVSSVGATTRNEENEFRHFGAGPVSTDSIDSIFGQPHAGAADEIIPGGGGGGGRGGDSRPTNDAAAVADGDDGNKISIGGGSLVSSRGGGGAHDDDRSFSFSPAEDANNPLTAEISQLALSSAAGGSLVVGGEGSSSYVSGTMANKGGLRPPSAKIVDLMPFQKPELIGSVGGGGSSVLLQSESSVAAGEGARTKPAARKGGVKTVQHKSESSSLNSTSLQDIPLERAAAADCSSSFNAVLPPSGNTRANSDRPGRIGAPFPREAYIEVMEYTLARRAMAPVLAPFDYSRAIKRAKPSLLRRLISTEQEQRHQYLRNDSRLPLSSVAIAGHGGGGILSSSGKPLMATTSLSRSVDFASSSNTAAAVAAGKRSVDVGVTYTTGSDSLDIAGNFAAPSVDPKPPSRDAYKKAINKAALVDIDLPFTVTLSPTATLDSHQIPSQLPLAQAREQASITAAADMRLVSVSGAEAPTAMVDPEQLQGAYTYEAFGQLLADDYGIQPAAAGSSGGGIDHNHSYSGDFATTVISSLMQDNEMRQEEMLLKNDAQGLAATLQALSQSRSPPLTALLRTDRTSLSRSASPEHGRYSRSPSSSHRLMAGGVTTHITRPISPPLWLHGSSSLLGHPNDTGSASQSDVHRRTASPKMRTHVSSFPEEFITPVAVPPVSVALESCGGGAFIVDKPLLISQPQRVNRFVGGGDVGEPPNMALLEASSSSLELQPRPVSVSREAGAGKANSSHHHHQRDIKAATGIAEDAGAGAETTQLHSLNSKYFDTDLPFERSFASSSDKSEDKRASAIQQLSTALTSSTEVNLYSIADHPPTGKSSGFLGSSAPSGLSSQKLVLAPVRTYKGILAKGKAPKRATGPGPGGLGPGGLGPGGLWPGGLGPGPGLQQDSSIYSETSSVSGKHSSSSIGSLAGFKDLYLNKQQPENPPPMPYYLTTLQQGGGGDFTGAGGGMLRAAPAPEDDGYVRVTKSLLVPSAGSRVMNNNNSSGSTSHILGSIVNLGVPSITSAPLPPEALGSIKTAAGVIVSSFVRVPHHHGDYAGGYESSYPGTMASNMPWIPDSGMTTLDHDRSDFVLGWEESKILKNHGGPDVSATKLRVKRQQYVRDSFEAFAMTMPASLRGRQISRQALSPAVTRSIYIGGRGRNRELNAMRFQKPKY